METVAVNVGVAYRWPCPDNQFSCGNRCLDKAKVCDGVKNCQYGQDEAMCDLNECLYEDVPWGHNCSRSESQCVDVRGSYRCQCREGFHQVDQFTCNKIEKCNGRVCDKNSVCTTVGGLKDCRCMEGYELQDPPYSWRCIDIDECSVPRDHPKTHKCGNGTSCINTDGSYDCHCHSGYRRIDRYTCKDETMGPFKLTEMRWCIDHFCSKESSRIFPFVFSDNYDCHDISMYLTCAEETLMVGLCKEIPSEANTKLIMQSFGDYEDLVYMAKTGRCQNNFLSRLKKN
ncbi:fibulin 1 [Elysia marginata]|uniref:Fibulin 1 n=1 Tax=Elysia marginata TaxID=1093978 RepID=A0AAV4FA77_9GAST|nr:fibulin 1 [Elysia marginata]